MSNNFKLKPLEFNKKPINYNNLLYHGNNVEVISPKIMSVGYPKDFGFGFYCTKIERQAKKWSLNKRGRHIVNIYSYIENPTLSKLTFNTMTEDWLDFIVHCRNGNNHDYDIVEGPIADDTIWDYIEDFTSGNISKSAFWELVKFKYPTYQILFCTDEALKSLTFERSYEIYV